MKYRNKSINLTILGRLLMLAFIILLLTFGASLRVNASEMDSAVASDTPSTAEYTVIGIENSEQLGNLASFELVRRSIQNTEPLFYHIYNNGLLSVTASIENSNGQITTQQLSVSWTCWDDSTTVTDTTVCGDYIETGIIQLPDDSYEWGEGVLSVLTLPVRVYDPAEPVEITEIYEVWNEFDVAFSLEQNDSIEELLHNEEDTISLQTAWQCFDANGNEYLCPVVYNTEDVREDTVGIYNITVTFDAPLNCRFSDTLTVPSYSIPVTVQAPGKPRLDVSYLSPSTEFIIFPWITSDIALDTMEVWMSENNGEWRILELDSEAYIQPTMLEIYAWQLIEGNFYQIQVDYKGGQTGIASFTYGWDILSDKGYIEGDRDGGDTDGNPPNDSDKDEADSDKNDSDKDEADSDKNENSESEDKGSDLTPTVQTPEPVITPAPDTEQMPETFSAGTENTSNDAGSESVKESSAPADTIANREVPYLLGMELNRMIQSTGAARFSEDTIMLDIPEDVIKSLNISETDRLLVNILPLKNNSFSVDISVNDIAITALSGMQISLPYQPAENTTPVLVNADGTVIAVGRYDESTGLVTFTINETGTFYIRDEEIPMQDTFTDNTLTETEISTPEENSGNSVFMLLTIAVTAIICSVAIVIFVYINKRRT